MEAESQPSETGEITTQKMLDDLKTVVRDGEELIKATAGELGEKTRAAREKLASALAAAKETCAGLEEKAVAGAKATDKAIREHPYESIGIAFGIGFLIGILVNRR
jgi:ElaB/YqjD/DUF883 family membrane-anchored ribosome-binding protein